MSKAKKREYPQDMPLDTIKYLQMEERKQQQHVKVATATRNVKETVINMHSVMDKMADRGQQLEMVEDQVDDLMEQSQEFYHATLPGWKRYALSWVPPSWWFPRRCGAVPCPCGAGKGKRKSSQLLV